MIRHSEKDRANYPRESFWCKEKETRVKILPRVSANRRSNNWALQSNVVSIILDTLTKISTSGLENLIMLSIFSTPFGKTPGDSRQPPPPSPNLNERRRKIEPNKGAAHFAREENHGMNLLRRVSVTIPLEAREKSESELKTSSLRQR